MELLSIVVTIVSFSVVGFFLHSGNKLPPKTISFVLLVCGFIVVSFIGVNTRLISVMQFSVFLNNCLQGLVLGVFARVLYKIIQVKKIQSK